MAINLKLPELKKQSRGKQPTKNYINILAVKKKTFSLRQNLPLVILIALLILAFCKFLVFDPLFGVVRESSQLSTLQAELEDANRQIEDMSDVDEMYAHYTTTGMTKEELSRVDRVKAMRLIEDAFLHGNISKSWNLTGNVMTLEVNGSSLKDLNQLAEELEEDPIVERCVISAADKHMDENGNVSVTFVIYLQKSGE
ncbi:MAG: hypothetical protein IJI20_03115 [Firmicutes bacterium]|nr:hypothetical protein [Bacillota bacterium]